MEKKLKKGFNMKKIFAFAICAAFAASLTCPAFSAGRGNVNTRVINDDWEDGWETTFFEKEAGKKQILKKENERPVVTPRSLRPKTQEKEESVRLPSRDEIEAAREQDAAYYDSIISAAEKKNAIEYSAYPYYSSLHPDSVLYFPIKFFHGDLKLFDAALGKEYGTELGIGFKKKSLRGEFDFVYSVAEEYNSRQNKFASFSGMFSIFADLHISGISELTPYIGFGTGLSHIRLRNPAWHGNSCALSWNAASGINYSFSQKFSAGIEYRYFNYGSPRIQKEDYSFESKQFVLEMKYYF